ncbi:polysaccharide pyruvyl transferase family protein [Novosphingobium resinovorum]|uniref:Polysaccharide pyruvyl transferase n=1 Tax=Novosphingobium resinovorum TaxID=158500 RepID=A0A1D8A7M4_9SPHN|nr:MULTISPECIES: polysaccharide pyruvyl transferase family protein [Novosphingobium]AOR78116.1 polysaccharide pyruvyl transferase [Novosphingobium resinovorum]WJM28247.1 polysaccharide pyruvyl transferase family protein [Novosphingobium resinovorum]
MPASPLDAVGSPARGRVRRQVFVCGDLHNLGDLKLLLQNLALTEGRGGIVRRWAPLPAEIERQVITAGGELVSGRAVLGFARRAFGAQIVLGGGQLVRDNVSIAALVGLLLAIVSARLGGGALVTRGLGVSVIRSPLRRALWQAILAQCGVVNLRDEGSSKNLERLFPGKARAVHADMVFLPTGGAHAIIPGGGPRRWIIVAPCADPSEGRSIEGDALDAVVARALDRLPGAGLAIACHDPRACMDKAVAARLVARWPDREITVFDGYDLARLVTLYREAALVVTNRLHALIFAILADAPALAVEDGTAKVRVVADRFDVPVLPREGRTAAGACLDAALSFDRLSRRRMRQNLALSAARNL